MDGILLVNKEKGMTSRDVVNKVCHLLGTKKVGHSGTLDPMASGVLVLGINKGLKVINDITALDKEYEAEITLGIETDTLDTEGKILKEELVNVTEQNIDSVLQTFVGDYDMEVPLYSAIKINGKKLYEYARNNEEVELPIHKVKVFDIKRVSNLKDNKFSIRCKVSKGTYIRSLVRDISNKLNTVGTMSNLVRLKQGKFSIENCFTLKEIENNNYELISIKDSVDIPLIEIDTNIYNRVKNGNKLPNIYKYDRFGFIYKNDLVAIYKIDINNKELVKPEKVLEIDK